MKFAITIELNGIEIAIAVGVIATVISLLKFIHYKYSGPKD